MSKKRSRNNTEEHEEEERPEYNLINDSQVKDNEEIVQPKKQLTSKEWAEKNKRDIRELRKNVLKHMGKWNVKMAGEATYTLKEFEKKDGTSAQRLEAQVMVEVSMQKDLSNTCSKMGTASNFYDMDKKVGTWHYTNTANKAMDEAVNEALKELWEMKQLELEIEQEEYQSLMPLNPSKQEVSQQQQQQHSEEQK